MARAMVRIDGGWGVEHPAGQLALWKGLRSACQTGGLTVGGTCEVEEDWSWERQCGE